MVEEPVGVEEIPDLRRVRLVATDLDGTFLDPGGQVTERAAAAVAAAQAAGIHVIPVTGRPPQALWEITDSSGLGPLAVCANGAAIVDVANRSVLEVSPMTGELAVSVVEAVRAAAPGIRMAADDLECFSFEAGFFDGPVDWQEKLEQVDNLLEVVAGGCIKLLARTRGTTVHALITHLDEVLDGSAYVTSSGIDWIDLGAPSASKEAGVRRVCEHLGVEEHAVAAIGDNHNDRSLLAWAPIALAPANAVTEVLAIAHRVLPGNDSHGVAALLEELAALNG